MRGVSIHWDQLGYLLLVLVVVGVGILLAMQFSGIDIKKYFGLQPVLGVPAEITYTTFPTPVTAEDTPETEHIVTAAGGTFQPSDLGCKIADYVYNDFSTLGEDGIRADCFLWDSGRENCIVGGGTFELDNAVADPGGAWEGILSARSCHYCGLATAWGNNPVFDEVCINYNMKDRKVGGSDFCKDQFSSTSTAEVVQFGNAQCMGGSEGGCVNTADWCDNCDGWWCDLPTEGCPWPCVAIDTSCKWESDGSDDFCDNEKDRIRWIVDTSDGDPVNRVKDIHAEDDGNWRIIDLTPNKYLYGTIWDHVDKRYDLLFVRVPKGRTENNFDWIKIDFKDWKRYNRLGNQFQYARMTSDATVTGANKNEIVLRQDIADEIFTGDASKVVFQECVDEASCLASGDSAGKPLVTDSGNEECDDTGGYMDFTSDYKFTRESIKFRTNIPQNGVFQAGNTYKVRVTNWYGKYGRQQGTSWIHCYSVVDRQVSIFCTNCCDNDADCEETWESVDCADCT